MIYEPFMSLWDFEIFASIHQNICANLHVFGAIKKLYRRGFSEARCKKTDETFPAITRKSAECRKHQRERKRKLENRFCYSKLSIIDKLFKLINIACKRITIILTLLHSSIFAYILNLFYANLLSKRALSNDRYLMIVFFILVQFSNETKAIVYPHSISCIRNI